MWYKPSANLRQGDMSFTAHYFRYSVLQSESYLTLRISERLYRLALGGHVL